MITKVNGSAPFTDGTYSPGVTNLLHQNYPQRQTVRIEIIDGIGVAPDYYIPETAKDVATGHDPDIAKALALLGR